MTNYIYTTGAFIGSYQLPNGKWCWIIREFEEDTFMNRDMVSVVESAGTEEGLILPEEDEDG